MRNAEEYGLHCATQVYGRSRTGNIDEKYLLAVLNKIAGMTKDNYIKDNYVYEIFTHPDLASVRLRELQALTSVAVSDRLKSLGIRRTGYKEISPNNQIFASARELCKSMHASFYAGILLYYLKIQRKAI